MGYISPLEEIQNIATKLKNKASGFVSKTAAPAVQNFFSPPQMRSPIPTFKAPTIGETVHKNFWMSPVGQGMVKAQNFVQSPEPITVANNIKNPVGRFVAQVPQSIVNSPFRSAQGITGLAGNVASKVQGKPVRYQDVLANLGKAADFPLNVVPIGKVPAVAKAGKQGLKVLLKKGAMAGAQSGSLFGLQQGLEKSREINDPVKYQGNVAYNTGVGAVVGAGTGAGLSGLLGSPQLVIRSVSQALKRVSPNIPDKQIENAAKEFIRNELGQFAKGSKEAMKSGKPFYKDPYLNNDTVRQLRQSLGLPDEGNYQGGFIKPDEFLRKDVPKGSYTNDPKIDNPLLNTQTPKQVMSSTDNYLKDLIQRQKGAKSSGPSTIKSNTKSILADIKEKFVDSTSPIEDALSSAEDQGKFKVLPKNDVRLQIDRVLRSKTIASQFAEDNGIVDVIKKAPDLDILDQYMIAKQATDVSARGIKTGRDTVKDNQLINDLSAEYEPLAQQVNQYSRKLLDYSVKSGLIDENLAGELVKKYKNYVPLQRVFNELEKQNLKGVGTRPVASLSRQSVVQRLQGSDREIASPIESLLLKTQDAFNQGERNQAAKMLASYKDLPGLKELITEVKGDTSSPHVFSYLDNGTKRTFETTPEIATAAKNLNQEQMGLIAKILSSVTRVLQLGATGLNLPFVATNVLKDEITGFVNSNRAAKTSILNPDNFVRALFSAVKHDDLYKEVIRNAAGGTSFDIARQAPELSVAKIRASRSISDNAKYTVRHPLELVRALENLVGRSEEVGRIKNYRGMKEALLKEGRTPQDAQLLAAKAARDNTANFARKGSWGRVLNWMIPFFNAGIQGGRQLTRSFKNNPAQTSAKVAVSIFMPVAASTAWNLSDPDRKYVYQDISDFEKENNIILIPDGASKDEQGRWNVIKIPLPPGLSNLSSLVRRPIEESQGLDPVKFSEVASNILTAGMGVDVTSPNKIISSTTPQALKIPLEMSLNKNLYTGKDIVPSYMQNKAPEAQVYSYTSGTARGIGKLTNTSPLKIENATKTALGGVGSQLLNASDRALNAMGFIPKEQIGGEGVVSNIQRRFSKSYGGEIKRDFEDQSAKKREILKDQAVKIYSQLKQLPPSEANAKAIQLKQTNIPLFNYLKAEVEKEKLGLTSDEKSVRDMGVADGARAQYIAQQFNRLKTSQEKKDLFNDWRKKKIITDQIVEQLKVMKKRGEL